MAPPPPLGSSDSGAAAAGATALDYNGRFRPRRQARGSPRNGLAGQLEDEVERDIGLVSEKTGMPTWAVVTLMIVILGWRSHLN